MSTPDPTNPQLQPTPPAAIVSTADRLSQARARRRELGAKYDALLKRVGAGEMALYTELTTARAERDAVDVEIATLNEVRQREDSIEADLRRIRLAQQQVELRQAAFADAKEALDIKHRHFAACIDLIIRAHEHYRECLKADRLSRQALRIVGDRSLWDCFDISLGYMRNSTALAQQLGGANGIAADRIDINDAAWRESVQRLADKYIAELKVNHEGALELLAPLCEGLPADISNAGGA
jgi:chromosome segregation ATPase